MSFEIIQQIPSPEVMLKSTPLSKELSEIKRKRDSEIKDVIEGRSRKFLVVIGPCSANDEDSLCDYVVRLRKLSDTLRNTLLIIPRIYTNKPRTTGEGYKGMLHQPDPEKEPNMVDGITAIRKMHIRAINESGFTAADEMLYPDNLVYVEDMLSYIAVGARSVENQQHRLTASGISLPVGMKNPTSGDLTVMFNSIQAAQTAHTFIYQGKEVKTSGNPLAHAILRGSVNKHGQSIPNYHYEDLLNACEMYLSRNLKNPMIVVDTNHANSNKLHFEQTRIAKEILYSRKYNSTIKNIVKGLMIESFIKEGSQKIDEHIYGKSITDPCLGFEQTEDLLHYIAENVDIS